MVSILRFIKNYRKVVLALESVIILLFMIIYRHFSFFASLQNAYERSR
ncbi:hypothetical protein KSS87_013455, partial [Heliosperma pusillum]